MVDFPESTCLEVEVSFRHFLFDKAISLSGSQRKLASVLSKISKRKLFQATIWRWKNGETKVPLWAFISIHKLLKNFGISFPNLKESEKHVVAFKGKGTSTMIKGCSFPIPVDVRMVRLVFHLMAEGSVGNGASNFANTCPLLRKEFINDLKVLGKVKTTLWVNRFLQFSKQVGIILSHIFKINFRSDKIRIPKKFWELDENLLKEGIRCLVDDEGCILDSSIKIFSTHKQFLLDVKELIKKKFPKLHPHITDVRIHSHKQKRKNTLFKIEIKSTGLEVFKKVIGNPVHPDKLDELEFLIKIQKKDWVCRPPFETKKIILKALKNGPKISKELKKICFVTISDINKHMRGSEKSQIPGLKELGLVKIIGKRKHSFLWSITSKGVAWLESKG